jgi:outer membrane biosynthesis protein TonB
MSIHKPKKSKRSGADRRWTLLFIGDHGNVITLKHFKAIVMVIGSLFFLAVVGALVLFFQHQGALRQNKDLQKHFTDSRKQIEKLRHEKEILMARLVRAEARTKENVAEDRQIPLKTKDAQPTAPVPQVASKPKPVKTAEKKSAVSQAAPPEPAAAETDEAEPVISVAVENFQVLRESGNKNLNAQFKIKNTSTAPQRVDGRIVVVLKGDGLQVNQWLVMPAVGLAGDKPSGKRGKSFSIQRFRTMNFTSIAPNYSDQFQSAAVYVFSKSGELLLEQEFSVELPPVTVSPAVTPSASPAPEKKPSTPTASEKTTSSPAASAQTPSSRKPGGESPESGDTSDSLESVPSIW